MTFQPIDPIELVQLTEQVRVSGLRHDQARFLVAKLAATENERQRLQAQVDDAGERRRGLRSMMTDEAQKTRDELEAAKKRIAELEVPRNLRELQQQSAGDAFLDCVGPSVNPYGLDPALRERFRLVESALRDSCAAVYYKTERDKLEADLQRLRALIDGAHI